MLFLLKKQQGANVYYLLSSKEYTVGRKNADIIINNDASVSRSHAVFRIGPDSATLKDCKSKYGTFRNDTKIQPEAETRLEDKDMIKFGVYESIFSFEKMSFVTTGSALNNAQKNDLKKKLGMIGGILSNNWDSTCTHLTTQEIVLTVKVLHALIDNKPIVKVEFWDKLINNVKKNLPPPNVDDFKPPLAESMVDSALLVYNPERRNIFQGKTLVFSSEKIKSKMDELIGKTGGICISWDTQPLPLLQITNSINSYLFIHSDDIDETPQSLKDIYENLSKLGQRAIPIQEIAMAILKCSCEKDCNPNFDRIENVFLKAESDSQSQVFPLAPETQSQEMEKPSKDELIIPGSLESNPETSPPIKASTSGISRHQVPIADTFPSPSIPPKRSLESREENLFKRMKMDISASSISPPTPLSCNSQKRRAEETPIGAPPKKSSMQENPFAILKNKNAPKKTLSDNPFATMRVKKETNPLEDNPFMKVAEQNRIEESVAEEPETSSANVTGHSYISQSLISTPLSNIKWLSKSACEVEPVETFTFKEELKNVYDLFRDTLVIEVLPVVPRRFNVSGSVNGSLNVSNGAKNFKKFKKVLPVRPQRSIISTTIPQFANVTRNNEVSVLSSDGEEDERPVRPVSKKAPKRFVF